MIKGEERGALMTKYKVIKNLLTSGMDLKEITKMLEMPVSEVKRIRIRLS